MAYKYESCGLDRVFLVNGYRLHTTPHGDAIAIEDVGGLHRTIARAIVCDAAILSGKELRFIRKHLDLSQKAFASLIGAEEQQVFRWEKAGRKPIPGMADRLVRVAFAEVDRESGLNDWTLKQLAGLDAKAPSDIQFNVADGHWGIAA